MLSVNLIQRFTQQREFDRLLQSLADNGMVMPLPLRVRLSDGPAAPIALGLRRLVELTYGPTHMSRDLADDLLALQNPDGSFSGAEAGVPDPLATAAALAAFTRVMREHPVEQARLDGPRHRALHALARMQADNGAVGFDCPADRTDAQRRLVAAFILFLLTSDSEFRSAVRFADLMSDFDDHADQLDEPTRQLWAMARLDHNTLPAEPVSAGQPAPCVAA